MSDEEKSVIEQVAEIATLAGLKGEIDSDGERFSAIFGFSDGRSQMVFIREIETPEGPGVCVYSAAARYKKSMFGGLSKKHAIELLTRNDNLYFTRFGLRDAGDETLVVASVDLLIATMDPEELRSAMGSSAAAADSWEEYAGQGDDL